MERYRRKQEILVMKWTGEESEIKEFREHLKSFKEFRVEMATSNDEKILCLIHDRGYDGTSTYYVHVGEYALLDINDELFPFRCIDERQLNEEYVKI